MLPATGRSGKTVTLLAHRRAPACALAVRMGRCTNTQMTTLRGQRLASLFLHAVNVVLAEDRLILSEAKAPQPDYNVHNSAPTPGLLHIIVRSGESVQEAPR